MRSIIEIAKQVFRDPESARSFKLVFAALDELAVHPSYTEGELDGGMLYDHLIDCVDRLHFDEGTFAELDGALKKARYDTLSYDFLWLALRRAPASSSFFRVVNANVRTQTEPTLSDIARIALGKRGASPDDKRLICSSILANQDASKRLRGLAVKTLKKVGSLVA